MVGERSDLLLRIGDLIFRPPKFVTQDAREFLQMGHLRRRAQ
jgi:hypothetical protein